MKKHSTKASLASLLAVATMASSMGVTTAFAADVTPGSNHTTWPDEYNMVTQIQGEAKVQVKVPGTDDRCSLKVYGVDKYQKNASDVQVVAYHIIEANYNQYGFLGWTQTAASLKLTKFAELASFQKTTDNVVQVVTNDKDEKSPLYNRGTVITSDDITSIASGIMNNSDPKTAYNDCVELTWSETENCYKTNNAKPGTYIVLVLKEDRGTIYNPMIVSNDYSNANYANTLSNYMDRGVKGSDQWKEANAANWKNASRHEDLISQAEPGKVDGAKYPYESGVATDNSKFTNYGTPTTTKPENTVTGDNKDLSPQEQKDYINSHESVTYYRDTQVNGQVFALYHDANKTTGMQEKNIETMALKGVAYAKKSTPTVEKNIVKASVTKSYTDTAGLKTNAAQGYSKYDDVSEGDTVTYDVLVQVPYYAKNYFTDEDQFIFSITDTQHEGLAPVQLKNIEIYAAQSAKLDAQAIATDLIGTNVYENASKKEQLGANNYKITVGDAKKNQFTVNFTKDWVLDHPGEMILVRYTTTVTDDAAKGLNGNPNEVFFEYTTQRTDKDGQGIPRRGYKFDFAIQYTFSPTAFKLAEDGTVVQTTGDSQVTVEDQADIAKSEEATKPLAGARFKLQRVGTHYNADNVFKATGYDIPKDTAKWKAATAADEKDPKKSWEGYQTWFLTSDEKGMIKFDSARDGIDEGIYILQEIEAPKDYTINDKIYVIDVNPTFDTNVQRFIGTDVKIGMAAGKNLSDINLANALKSMTFVDGTNYDYDEYGKLLRSYTYSEWVSNQIDSYDGKVSDLTAATAAQDSTVNPTKGAQTEIHKTVVSYKTNAAGETQKVAETKSSNTDLIGIINTKLTRLPSTGGVGTMLYTMGGFALMGVAAALLKKKKDEESK